MLHALPFRLSMATHWLTALASLGTAGWLLGGCTPDTSPNTGTVAGDTTTSDAALSDSVKADTPKADTAQADAVQTDAAQADADQTDATLADTATADTAQADTAPANTATTATGCGNGTCDNAETLANCPTDCTQPPKAGHICDTHCGVTPSVEGCDCSAQCKMNGTCCDAAGDLPDPAKHNYLCVTSSCWTCNGASGPKCGNGVCEYGEASSNCPADCGTQESLCGNGKCAFPESKLTCPADCGSTPNGGHICDVQCGNTVGVEGCSCDSLCKNVGDCCDGAGDPPDLAKPNWKCTGSNCWECNGAGAPVCGNGICEFAEDANTCAADCGK